MELKKYISKLTIYETNLFLLFHLFLIFYIVNKFSNHLEPFEDEFTSLISGISFLTNLDFNGSPLINGNYSPYLTSGPISSIGSGLGWLITKNLTIARQVNFYFLILIGFILFLLIDQFKNLKTKYKFNVFMFSIILLPWWFGSLYSLGEVFSSVFFTVSILIIKDKPNVALILMGISVIFGKLLQILLVMPFLFFYFSLIKKINLKNFISLLTPYILFIFLVIIKVKNVDLYSYSLTYLDIIYNHQSSGLSISKIFSFDSFLKQLQGSEFTQWSLATILRVTLSPLIFLFIVIYERKNLQIFFSSVIPLVSSILIPYLWFVLFSQTKWIRYSQHYLYVIILFSLIFLFYDLNFREWSRALVLLNLSLFLSSSMLIVIFLFSLIFINKKKLFRSAISIILIFNLVNISLESASLIYREFNLEVCEKNIATLECVNAYLPYSFNP